MDQRAGPTILVVEDEFLVRFVAAEMLHGAGYSVLAAASAEEALTILAEDPSIALLVTDIRLPGINGWQLVEKARLARPGIAVLFITGYPDSLDEEDGMARSTILRKPLMPEELQREAASLLAQGA